MRCDEVMKTDVKSVLPNESVEDAARGMRDTNIGFMPVCDKSGRIRGVITDRDIAVRLVAEGRPPETSVEEIMTREVVACRLGTDLREARAAMEKAHVSRLLCVAEDGHLVGVISLSDLAVLHDGDASQTLKRVSERGHSLSPLSG